MKDLLRRGLAMLMSVVMTLSLFVGYLPTEAFAAETENIASEGYRPQVKKPEPPAPEPKITITSNRENNTLDYIGDTLTLTATLENAPDAEFATEWSSSDSSVATVEDGVVTAQNFHPTETDLKRTVTITVTMKELSAGDAEEKVYEGSWEIVVQYSIQPLFYYALIPGHNENIENGNGDSDWFGIGEELIAGAKPATEKSRDVGNLQYEVVGIRKELYPDITYEGTTYKYNSTEGNGYTLDPFRLVSDKTANGGNNGYNSHQSGDPFWTYHADHRLNFTEPGELCNVNFLVKDPGATKFALEDTRRAKKGTLESDITQPEIDHEKTEKGIIYTFDGWHTDADCSVKAEFQGTITDNTFYYGQYVATQAKYTIRFFYDGTENQAKAEHLTGNIGDTIRSSDAAMQELIERNTISGYTYTNATPESITLTAGGTNEIHIHYTKHNVTVSYDVAGRPTGVNNPTGGSYKLDDSVRAAVMNVPGYDFSGWTTTDIAEDHTETKVTPGETFKMPGNNVTLKGTLTPMTDTPYKVEHYQQNINDNGYTLADREDCKGTTGTTANAVAKNYPGFTLNPEAQNAKPSGTITGDGKLVLRLYYTRDMVEYKVEHYLQQNPHKGMTADNYMPDATDNLTARLGKEVTAQPKTYTDYEHVKIDGLTVDTGVVTADGKLVLKLYYNKADYNVTYTIVGNVGKNNEPADEKHAEGATVTVKTPKDIPGYTFVGWAENASGLNDPHATVKYPVGKTFTMPGENLNLHGRYVENPATAYKVEHYTENADGTYSLNETEDLTGTTGSKATATVKSYPGFTHNPNAPGTLLEGTIAGDGSLVLKVYYDINSHSVTYQYDASAPAGATPPAHVNNVKRDTTVTIAGEPNIPGFRFLGWKITEPGGVVRDGDTFTMPDHDVVLTGSFEPIMANYDIRYFYEHDDGRYVEDYPDLKISRSAQVTTTVSATQADVNRGIVIGYEWRDTALPTLTVSEDQEENVIEVYYNKIRYNITYQVTWPEGYTEKEPDSSTGTYLQLITVEQEPTITGYTFSGWRTDDTKTLVLNGGKTVYTGGNTFYMPANDVTFTGTFTPNPADYTINYYLVGTGVNGVEPIEAKESETVPGALFGETVTKTAPAIDGYTTYMGDDQDTAEDGCQKTVKISTSGNEITFYYYKNVTVTAEEKTKVFGDKDPELTAYADGVLTGDSISYSLSRAQGEAVGDYAITVKGPTDQAEEIQGYYSIRFVPNVLHITANPALVINAHDGGGIYSGTPYKGTVHVTGYKNGEQPTLHYTDNTGKNWGSTEPELTDAGTITVTVTASLAGYDSKSATYTIAVTARDVTLTSASAKRVYDGTALIANDASVTSGSFVDGEGVGYNFPETSSRTDVGTTENEFSCVLNTNTKRSNYNITLVPGKLTVTPRAITLSGENKTVTYNGTEWSISKVSADGLVGWHQLSGASCEIKETDANPAGYVQAVTGNIRITDPDDGNRNVTGNYTITMGRGTLTINRRPIIVNGGQNEAEYDGQPHSVTGVTTRGLDGVAESGLVDEHEVEASAQYNIREVNAGDYSATGTVVIKDGDTDVSGNYDITYNPAVLKINKRVITIKPVDVTAVYDGQVHGATAYEYVDGSMQLVEGDTLNVTYSDGITDVGNVTSSLTATEGSARSADGNYDIRTETGTVEVTKRALTLTGNADAVTFNGATQSVEGFTTGAGQLVSGEQLGSVSYRAEGRNAGTYTGRFTGTPVILSGSKDVTANYDIDTQDSTLTISPARLTVRSESANKVYDGEALTNGRVTVTLEGQALTAETVPGRVGMVTLPNGETVGILVTGTQTEAGSTANTGAINWNGSSSGSYTALASNYISSFEYGRLTVTDSEDEIVVTTTGGVFTYDGLPHGATVTVSELPEGYTLERAVSNATAQTVLDGTVAATCDELVIRNALGEDVTDELNIRYVNSTLIIERAPLYITTLSATKEYDGEPLTAGVTVTGLVNNETVSVMPTGSQTEIGTSQNGYHVAWVGTAKVYNYEIVETLGTLTVVPVGQVPAPQALDEGDNPPDVRVVETMLLEDEIVPLAGNTEKCCIMHFLLALLALITVLISGHDTKKLQEKITELKKKETPEDGANDDSRTAGGKDDN